MSLTTHTFREVRLPLPASGWHTLHVPGPLSDLWWPHPPVLEDGDSASEASASRGVEPPAHTTDHKAQERETLGSGSSAH